MKKLTEEQATTLLAFLNSFDLYGSGWPYIEQAMQEEWLIPDPETKLEEVRRALQGEL